MLRGDVPALDLASAQLDRAASAMEEAAEALRRLHNALRADRPGQRADQIDQVRMIGEMAHAQSDIAAGLALLVRQLPRGRVDELLSQLALAIDADQARH